MWWVASNLTEEVKVKRVKTKSRRGTLCVAAAKDGENNLSAL